MLIISISPSKVVIKYVPYVGDSKRAMDEYTSEIFMGGHNTIVLHNTCEDSLLASPIIIDLVILAELCERIQVKNEGGSYERFHPVLSVLSYLLKAPMVPPGTPVVNALFRQRACIENIFRYDSLQTTPLGFYISRICYSFHCGWGQMCMLTHVAPFNTSYKADEMIIISLSPSPGRATACPQSTTCSLSTRFPH